MTHRSVPSRGTLAWFLPSALLAIAFCLLYSSMWSGGLWWKDNWCAILTTTDNPLHPQLAADVGKGFSGFWSYAFQRDLMLHGRFRPLHWALTTAESALMRDHPHLWIAETHLIGISACVLLFFTGRRLGLGTLSALLLSLWIMIATRRLWAELQLSEEPGLFLTVLAIYSIVRAADKRSRTWDALGLASTACAALFKESFVLVIPALLLFRVLLERRGTDMPSIRAALRRVRWVVAIGGLMWLTLSTVVILLLLDPDGYDNTVVAGVATTERWSPIRWAEMLWAWSGLFALFTPLLGLAWLAPALRSGSRARRDLLLGALVLVLWLGPQLLIYSASGFREHYFVPAIFPVAFACALGIELLLRQRSRWLAWGILALSAASLQRAGVEAASVVSRIAAASDVQAHWMESTADAISQGGRILLVTDNLAHSRNMTFLTMLGEKGVHPPVSLFVGSTGNMTDNSVAMQAALTCFPESAPFDKPPIDVDAIEVIACMMSERHFRSLAEGWYRPEDWSCLQIDRAFTQGLLTFWPPNLSRKAERIQYAVLTRKH